MGIIVRMSTRQRQVFIAIRNARVFELLKGEGGGSIVEGKEVEDEGFSHKRAQGNGQKKRRSPNIGQKTPVFEQERPKSNAVFFSHGGRGGHGGEDELDR
jgi:hypothetical protein